MSSSNIKARLTAEADKIYAASISNFESAIEPTPTNRVKYMPRLFILFIILVSFIIGRFRFSFITLAFFAYTLNYIYNRRIHKFTRSMNNLVFKEALRLKASNNYESVEWMNHIISRLWGVIESEVSRQVIARANILLQEKTPQFINSIKLSSFTLGSSAPTILGITHFEDVDAECVCIEAEFAFVPLEIGKDAYHYVTKKRCFEWNSKIVLMARLGSKVKGVGVNLQILVKKISVKGRMRINLKLCSEKIVNSLEIMFVEKPEIDFDLVPLRTVDLMDVPGLSKWIGFVIDTALKSMVNPESLVIDLTKPIKREVVKGVLLLRISNMIMKEDDTVEIMIGIDGRMIYKTAKKTGSNIFFNEYFFLITMASDETLLLEVRSNNTFYGDGKIPLKMIFEVERHCEAIRIFKKGNVRGVVNCSFKLYNLEDNNEKIKNEIPKTIADQFKITEFEQNFSKTSAVVNIKVIQCEDLRGLNYSRNKIYSTFFSLIASPKLEKLQQQESHPFSFVTGPVNATALLIGGALTTATNAIAGNGSNREDLLPSSTSTFFVYESKIAPDTNSPLFNEQEKFFVRNLQNDFLYIRVNNADNNEVIGNIELKIAELKNEESWHKLKNAQRGRIKLATEVLRLKYHIEDFVDYKKAVSITIKNISSVYQDCVMYGIVKTKTDSFYIEPFLTGDLQNERNIVLPVNDSLRIRIYKMGEGVDDYIGEACIDISHFKVEENDALSDIKINNLESKDKEVECQSHQTDQKGDIFLPLILYGDENGSIKANIKTSNLTSYKGTCPKSAFKVVQVMFRKFYNMKEEFIVEFKNATETIQKSPISRNMMLSDRFLLLVGDCEIRAIFKSAEIGVNKVIGDCLIPKRAMKERVVLDEETISADIEIKVLTSHLPYYSVMKIGILELKIISASNLASDKYNSCDPFVKIFLNGSRIHKTAQIKGTLNPTFNDSINLKINSMVDILRIEVFDWNQFEKNKILAFKEIPLYFLKQGSEEYDVRLINATTFKPDASKIKLGFNFMDQSNKKNEKIKGVLRV